MSPVRRPLAITITIEQTPLRYELDDAFRRLPLLSLYRINIAALRRRLHHSIRVGTDIANLHTTNCHAFAFGIGGQLEYHALVEMNKHVLTPIVDAGFTTALIAEQGLREIGDNLVAIGDIAIYFAQGQVVHSGIVISPERRIRSKWGTGVLHDHALGEVPASYGDEVRFFAAPDPTTIYPLLWTWDKRLNSL